MRVYTAGTVEDKERIQLIQKQFRDKGHVIDVDWTTHKWVAEQPKEEQEQLFTEYAIEDVQGVREAEVFILILGNRKSVGAHIELGVALGAKVPHIYIVGQTDDPNLFYFHPNVKVVETIDTVLGELEG